jgi:23S rRNA pseudouridine1911/1915/1917 synthase
MPSWIVDASHADTRLDVFLTEVQAGKTRSSIQKAIQRGLVRINDSETTVHHFLKEGDNIVWDEAFSPKKAVPATSDMPMPTIIEETADWLVIDKPAGLLTHPSNSSREPTLVEWFLAHSPEAKQVGEEPSRPGVVHRLDRDVSGLLVLAKTQAAFEALKRDFAQRNVEKRYLTLVHGEIPKEEDDIKLKIARSTSKARMAARPKEEEGKAAWTHYKVRERFVGATLLDVEILSGRTHQIRAHLHGIGHPVIGDPLYKRRQTDRNVKPNQILLQSIHLAFTDPTTGERKSFDLAPHPIFEETTRLFRPHQTT